MKKVILLLIFGLCLASFVHGEITLSQPSSVYNLGDNLNITATIKTLQNTNGFFDMNLVCNNVEKNVYRMPLTLDGEKNIDISLLLTPDVSTGGNCEIKAVYNSQQTVSQGFEISNQLDVFVAASDIIAEAGKDFVVSGTALRANAEKVNGGVEISVENGSVKSTGLVQDGKFSVNFSMPEDSKSGRYLLVVRAYESYNGQTTNQGETSLTAYVKQTPRSIAITMINQSVSPEEKINFNAAILDQANEVVDGKITLSIYDAKSVLIDQEILNSNEYFSFKLASNSTPGYWKIAASALGLNQESQFYVNEYEKASIDVANETLTMTNIGNVPYNKSVEISIGDYSEVKNVYLGLEEQIKLRLNAPDGEYKVRVSDGSENVDTQSFLTGSAIGVSEFGSSNSLRYYVVWIFLVLVLGLFIVNIVRRSAKRFSIDSIKDDKPKPEAGVIKLDVVDEAEHVLVMDGRKEQASLVVVNLKNGADKTILDKIRGAIKSGKGSVYHSGSALIGIFSSQTTRTFSNEMLAVRAADSISSMLRDYNKLARNKIEYGIGVNSGELVVKKGDKLRFTSIGNTLPLGKKIAELAGNEILLSEAINSRIAGEVKTVRKQISDLGVYNIKEISDRGKHEKFISSFLQRQRL